MRWASCGCNCVLENVWLRLRCGDGVLEIVDRYCGTCAVVIVWWTSRRGNRVGQVLLEFALWTLCGAARVGKNCVVRLVVFK